MRRGTVFLEANEAEEKNGSNCSDSGFLKFTPYSGAPSSTPLHVYKHASGFISLPLLPLLNSGFMTWFRTESCNTHGWWTPPWEEWKNRFKCSAHSTYYISHFTALSCSRSICYVRQIFETCASEISDANVILFVVTQTIEKWLLKLQLFPETVPVSLYNPLNMLSTAFMGNISTEESTVTPIKLWGLRIIWRYPGYCFWEGTFAVTVCESKFSKLWAPQVKLNQILLYWVLAEIS